MVAARGRRGAASRRRARGGRRGPAADAVDDERLGDDLLDRHARVERGERVLEDRLRLAAVAAQRALRTRAMSAPLKTIGPRSGR